MLQVILSVRPAFTEVMKTLYYRRTLSGDAARAVMANNLAAIVTELSRFIRAVRVCNALVVKRKLLC